LPDIQEVVNYPATSGIPDSITFRHKTRIAGKRSRHFPCGEKLEDNESGGLRGRDLADMPKNTKTGGFQAIISYHYPTTIA